MPVIRAAKVALLDSEDNVLLLRRSETHPHTPLRDDLPGGIIEDGESFEIGVCREVKEETGLAITPDDLQLLFTVTHNYFGKPISRLLYGARIDTLKPLVTVSWEHDRYSWSTLSELKNLEKPYQKGIDYANEHNLWAEF